MERLDDSLVDVGIIREALHMYSCWFIDWEEMYYTPKYRPEFPKHLIDADNALKRLEQTIKVFKEPPKP